MHAKTNRSHSDKHEGNGISLRSLAVSSLHLNNPNVNKGQILPEDPRPKAGAAAMLIPPLTWLQEFTSLFRTFSVVVQKKQITPEG